MYCLPGAYSSSRRVGQMMSQHRPSGDPALALCQSCKASTKLSRRTTRPPVLQLSWSGYINIRSTLVLRYRVQLSGTLCSTLQTDTNGGLCLRLEPSLGIDSIDSHHGWCPASSASDQTQLNATTSKTKQRPNSLCDGTCAIACRINNIN
jgi:hypothetical protein